MPSVGPLQFVDDVGEVRDDDADSHDIRPSATRGRQVGWTGAAAGAAPEPHPATPTAKPAYRHANRPTRIWRIDLPFPPGTPCGAGGAGDLRESIVRWTGGAGSQFPS